MCRNDVMKESIFKFMKNILECRKRDEIRAKKFASDNI